MAQIQKKIDPRQQFSKKLAGRAEWFWLFYMTLLAALVAYRPEAAVPAISFAALVTAVMITSVLAYTDNSKYEKGLYAPNQIAKMNWVEAFGGKQKEKEKDADEEEGGEG